MQNETAAFWIIHHFNLKTAVKENKNGAAALFSRPQLPFSVILTRTFHEACYYERR
jgi:hypothetical protein